MRDDTIYLSSLSREQEEQVRNIVNMLLYHVDVHSTEHFRIDLTEAIARLCVAMRDNL